MIKTGQRITEDELKILANVFNLELNKLKALIIVETDGEGFYKDKNYPKIRFENHWFNKLTKKKYEKQYPELTTSFWIKNYNLKGINEITRFDKAFELDEKASMLATSWGLGQVMGFNYKLCNYETIEDFVKDMFISELNQLKAMLYYMVNVNILDDLRNNRYSSFFYRYNGKDYAKYEYDKKFIKEYKKLKENER